MPQSAREGEQWLTPASSPQPRVEQQQQCQTCALPSGRMTSTPGPPDSPPRLTHHRTAQQIQQQAQQQAQQQQQENMAAATLQLEQLAAQYGGSVPWEVIGELPQHVQNAAAMMEQHRRAIFLRQQRLANAHDQRMEERHRRRKEQEARAREQQRMAEQLRREQVEKEAAALEQRRRDVREEEEEQQQRLAAWQRFYRHHGGRPSEFESGYVYRETPAVESSVPVCRLGFGSFVELAHIYPTTGKEGEGERGDGRENTQPTKDTAHPSTTTAARQDSVVETT